MPLPPDRVLRLTDFSPGTWGPPLLSGLLTPHSASEGVSQVTRTGILQSTRHLTVRAVCSFGEGISVLREEVILRINQVKSFFFFPFAYLAQKSGRDTEMPSGISVGCKFRAIWSQNLFLQPCLSPRREESELWGEASILNCVPKSPGSVLKCRFCLRGSELRSSTGSVTLHF